MAQKTLNFKKAVASSLTAEAKAKKFEEDLARELAGEEKRQQLLAKKEEERKQQLAKKKEELARLKREVEAEEIAKAKAAALAAAKVEAQETTTDLKPPTLSDGSAQEAVADEEVESEEDEAASIARMMESADEAEKQAIAIESATKDESGIKYRKISDVVIPRCVVGQFTFAELVAALCFNFGYYTGKSAFGNVFRVHTAWIREILAKLRTLYSVFDAETDDVQFSNRVIRIDFPIKGANRPLRAEDNGIKTKNPQNFAAKGNHDQAMTRTLVRLLCAQLRTMNYRNKAGFGLIQRGPDVQSFSEEQKDSLAQIQLSIGDIVAYLGDLEEEVIQDQDGNTSTAQVEPLSRVLHYSFKTAYDAKNKAKAEVVVQTQPATSALREKATSRIAQAASRAKSKSN